MDRLLWIGAAGALGAVARYLLGGLVQRAGGVAFPWGTAAVNVLGSLIFGIIWSLAEDRLVISGEARFIFLTGFVGSFTTFSTLMFETGALLQEAAWELALLNLVGQNAVGLVAIALGLLIGRLL